MGVIDASEKKVLYITFLLIGVFIFSILYAKDHYKSDVPECVPFDKVYLTPGIDTLDDKTYRVFAIASMWQFQPSKITLPVGSAVDFFLSSKDVVHGFNISQKNVNMMAVYGSINKTTVKFDKPGKYYITCHEYCGIGHQFMQGEIIISERKFALTNK